MRSRFRVPSGTPAGSYRRPVGESIEELRSQTAARRALHAIERGEATEENFTAVGDGWDVEERARAELDRLGLAEVGLDRTVGTLSAGETIMVGLAARFLARPEVLLLDEPTNNLDLDARHRLYDAVATWPGVLIVVSHDVPFLRTIGITRWLRLDRDAGLAETDPMSGVR